VSSAGEGSECKIRAMRRKNIMGKGKHQVEEVASEAPVSSEQRLNGTGSIQAAAIKKG